MSLWDIFKHWTRNKVLQVLPRFLLLSRFPIFVTYHWEKHGSVGAPVGMLNHSHLLRPPPLPLPCKISRVLVTLLGTWHRPCSAHQSPSLLPIHAWGQWGSGRLSRFWFSPFLPSPSRADRSPLVEKENYAWRSRERKLAAALLWVRIRSSLAATLGVGGSVYWCRTHTHTYIMNFPQSSDHPDSLCVLHVVFSGVWGTTGPSVCLCLELRAVNFMTWCVWTSILLCMYD